MVQNTLALDTSECDSFPCFVINDLTKDSRFSDLPIVNGTLATYKWYVGVPITTNHRVNIGVLFVFGKKKLDGLSLEKRKCKFVGPEISSKAATREFMILNFLQFFIAKRAM